MNLEKQKSWQSLNPVNQSSDNDALEKGKPCQDVLPDHPIPDTSPGKVSPFCPAMTQGRDSVSG